MTLHSWFPTSLYLDSLDPPKKVHREMVRYVERFYEENKQHYTYCLTGDAADDDDVRNNNLHHQSTFSWLNKQVFIGAQKYLESLGANIDDINIYASKAWPVVLKKGGVVNKHRHQNSVLSVIYYLQCDNKSGGIKFYGAPSEVHFLPIGFKNLNKFSYTNCAYPPIENGIIVFPSSLEHEVLIHEGDNPRYSISYDLIFTMKRNSYMEFAIPDPSEWKVLG